MVARSPSRAVLASRDSPTLDVPPAQPSAPTMGERGRGAAEQRTPSTPTTNAPALIEPANRSAPRKWGAVLAAGALLLLTCTGAVGLAAYRARLKSEDGSIADAAAARPDASALVSALTSEGPTAPVFAPASVPPVPSARPAVPVPSTSVRPMRDASAPAATGTAPWCGQDGLFCDGDCVHVTSDARCGACNVACRSPQHCRSTGGYGPTSWSCGVCPPGTDACPGRGCVDTAISPSHCGRCGHMCLDGRPCINGACGKKCARGVCTD